MKCRERFATLSSEIERVLLCRVKFDQSQIVECCRVLSRAFGHPTRLSRAHARAVATVSYIIGNSVIFIEHYIVKSRERLARAFYIIHIYGIETEVYIEEIDKNLAKIRFGINHRIRKN